MRLLIDTFDNTRLFKDRSMFGLPRWIVETIDPNFGFRHVKVLSGIWYSKDQAIKIAKEENAIWIKE